MLMADLKNQQNIESLRYQLINHNSLIIYFNYSLDSVKIKL